MRTREYEIVIISRGILYSTLVTGDLLRSLSARFQVTASLLSPQRIQHRVLRKERPPSRPPPLLFLSLAASMPYRPATVTETSVIEGYELPVGKTFAGQEQLPR